MHDIKYIFLNKNNQIIQRGKKNFKGDKLLKILSKNTIFQNPGALHGMMEVPCKIFIFLK
jgi:hypothetical protein